MRKSHFSLYLMACLCFVLFSCASEAPKDKSPLTGQANKGITAKTKAANIARILASDTKDVNGKKVYNISCLLCHGKNGDQKANNAMDLTTSTLDLEQRIDVIAHGRKLMTPFSDKLQDEEIKAVAEYVATLRK